MPYANREARIAASRRFYQANRERLVQEARERRQRRVESGEHQEYLDRTRAQRAEYKRQQRINAGAKRQDLVRLHAAINRAGRLPSVARLVYDQQREHWRQNPEDRAEYVKQAAIWRFRLRYMTDESFRLYHRSKSKRRKAQQRGSTAILLSPDQLWRRWVEFGHRCAYCGVDGDLHMEHVVPISKGGEHHLGNIVPACQTCNYSKGKNDARVWYRTQPFFSEERWLCIQTALDKSRPTTEQLGVALE